MIEHLKSGTFFDQDEHSIFVAKKLRNKAITNPANYMQAMSIVDFIEYLGMLEDKNYLKIDDLEPLIGEVVIQYESVVGRHIQELRKAFQMQAENQNLNVPDTYELFTSLALKFRTRFQI
jgi:hypothetical protein